MTFSVDHVRRTLHDRAVEDVDRTRSGRVIVGFDPKHRSEVVRELVASILADGISPEEQQGVETVFREASASAKQRYVALSAANASEAEQEAAARDYEIALGELRYAHVMLVDMLRSQLGDARTTFEAIAGVSGDPTVVARAIVRRMADDGVDERELDAAYFEQQAHPRSIFAKLVYEGLLDLHKAEQTNTYYWSEIGTNEIREGNRYYAHEGPLWR